MLTLLFREELTKQRYNLIGIHSGVKLCRWTKVATNLQFNFHFQSQIIHDIYIYVLYISIHALYKLTI